MALHITLASESGEFQDRIRVYSRNIRYLWEVKMPEIILFGQPWSGYKIEGTDRRFHLNFNMRQYILSWQLVREIINTPQDREYRFTKEELPNSHLRVVFKECYSIVATHEIIQKAQLTISGPPPEKDRPDGFDFGDVYRQGYWARDNIYMYVHDLSDPKLSTSEIIKFQKTIDEALLTVPEVTVKKTEMTPEINTFSAPGSTKLKEPTSLEVVINDSDIILPELTCKFFAQGGEIFMDQNKFFYEGAIEGKQSLQLYVTNSAGFTSMKQLEIEVKQV
jgi:hypothetical protein